MSGFNLLAFCNEAYQVAASLQSSTTKANDAQAAVSLLLLPSAGI